MSSSIIRRRLTRAAPRPTNVAPVQAAAGTARSAASRLPLAAAALILACGGSALLARGALAAAANAAWWRPDDAVAAALMGLGALISAWYALTALALLASALSRVNLGVRTWGAPLLRTLGVGAGSITLALTAPTIANATELLPGTSLADPAWSSENELGMAWTGEPWGGASAPDLAREHSAADLLTAAPVHAGVVVGAPVTPVAVRSATDPEPERAPAPTPVQVTAEVAAPSSSHVVSPGECLWNIAAAENPGASNAWIAARVAQYVAANPVLAANPDLIFPGQVLAIPEVQP